MNREGPHFLALAAIDESLVPMAGGSALDIYHIGRSAIVWQYDSIATTNDVDVLRPKENAELVKLALSLFGKDTDNAKERGIYLEMVDEAYPPMPAGYEKRAHQVDGPWKVLKVYHLDPHDLAASKLRRFAVKDREDIRHLCDLAQLDPEYLEEILESAFPFNLPKDGDDYRDGPFANLRIVQKYLRGEIKEF